MTERVFVDNFVRAETARMFDGMLAQIGSLNQWWHLREPVPLDKQAVIRMNRDTLYSSAIVDLSDGAVLEVPHAGDRYISVMVVNEDHFINRVFTEPGRFELTMEEFDTRFVNLSARILTDPDDPADNAIGHAWQDGLRIEASASGPYEHPDYDTESLERTRSLLLELMRDVPDSRYAFGSADDVDPIRHLVGTAAGWGGLPEAEAFYEIESEPRPVGHYRVEFADMPCDAFWSITVYNEDGFFEPNEVNRFSFNSVTATPEPDGRVTVDLDPVDRGYTNHLPVMDGWNYVIRLYRPHQVVLDAEWEAPAPKLIELGSDSSTIEMDQSSDSEAIAAAT